MIIEDGELWVEKRFDKWEINPNGEITVNVSADQNVIIDKMYGPQCSSDIRCRHEFDTCEWVIEERNFHNNQWVERARFFAQEFYKDEYENSKEDTSK